MREKLKIELDQNTGLSHHGKNSGKSLLTFPGNAGARFSRKEFIPSLASAEVPVALIPAVSILCASMGSDAPSIFHIMCRVRVTEIEELLSTIS